MAVGTFDDVRRAQRILIHGVSGSGKSTAAIILGRVLRIPVTLVDEEMQVIARLLKRTAHRNITKQKLCNGNVETLRNTFPETPSSFGTSRRFGRSATLADA